MKKAIFLIAFVALAACGADGAPMRPSANLGVNIGSDGVSSSAGVGASNGTFSVGVNL